MSQLRTYGPADHDLRAANFSARAVAICEKLQAAGHLAYIVGGGVRDLIAGLRPKDFDVATSARPEEIRQAYPRARLIGRRFPIVHEGPPQNPIEVATFRRPKSRAERLREWMRGVGKEGRKSSDRYYSKRLDDDLGRRDFTVNALYFDPVEERILDFVGGYQDIREGRLRCIGVPEKRLREDPVRVFRALRIAAKCGLAPDAELEKALGSGAREWVSEIHPGRQGIELEKFFLQGHAEASLEILEKYDLVDALLFEGAAAWLAQREPLEVSGLVPGRLYRQLARQSDWRHQRKLGGSSGFLMGVLAWPALAEDCWKLQGAKGGEAAFAELAEQGLAPVVAGTSVPNWRKEQIAAALVLQWCLTGAKDELPRRVLRQPGQARLALELLRLRQGAGEPLAADMDALFRQCPSPPADRRPKRGARRERGGQRRRRGRRAG